MINNKIRTQKNKQNERQHEEHNDGDQFLVAGNDGINIFVIDRFFYFDVVASDAGVKKIYCFGYVGMIVQSDINVGKQSSVTERGQIGKRVIYGGVGKNAFRFFYTIL